MADRVLKFSSSPHVKAPKTTKAIMLHVCIALMPACIMGVVLFGLKALLLLCLSLVSAVLSEVIYLLITGQAIKEIIKDFDFSSCVTGLLLGMSIGTNYPWYAPVLGSMFAVIVVKMLFGGTGKNLVNPAVTGRIFVFMSFQTVVSAWAIPSILSLSGAEVTTGATILTGLTSKEIFGLLDAKNSTLPALSNLDMLLGAGVMGCIGETCKLALIIGGIYLAVTGIINIGYPIIYIAVTGLFAVVLNKFNFAYFLPSILSGGLILGAIFMATDYTTTPNTTLGNIIYFIALGLVTAILRQATHMEVVSFAILLMNLFVPLIDKFIINKPFGYKKEKKIKGA